MHFSPHIRFGLGAHIFATKPYVPYEGRPYQPISSHATEKETLIALHGETIGKFVHRYTPHLYRRAHLPIEDSCGMRMDITIFEVNDPVVDTSVRQVAKREFGDYYHYQEVSGRAGNSFLGPARKAAKTMAEKLLPGSLCSS